MRTVPRNRSKHQVNRFIQFRHHPCQLVASVASMVSDAPKMGGVSVLFLKNIDKHSLHTFRPFVRFQPRSCHPNAARRQFCANLAEQQQQHSRTVLFQSIVVGSVLFQSFVVGSALFSLRLVRRPKVEDRLRKQAVAAAVEATCDTISATTHLGGRCNSSGKQKQEKETLQRAQRQNARRALFVLDAFTSHFLCKVAFASLARHLVLATTLKCGCRHRQKDYHLPIRTSTAKLLFPMRWRSTQRTEYHLPLAVLLGIASGRTQSNVLRPHRSNLELDGIGRF